MNWGFWKGEMKIDLRKRTFQPGETIEGTVRIDLKKPTRARALIVRFKGEEIVRTNQRGRDGRDDNRTETYVICDVKERIGGAKEYLKDEVPFRIRIPQDVVRRGRGSAMGNAVGGVLGALTGKTERSEFRWYIKAGLDIPKGIDVSKTEKINVYE